MLRSGLSSPAFLGGVVSATFVLAGAAAPPLAQTAASSPLTTVAQKLTGSQISGDICNMARCRA